MSRIDRIYRIHDLLRNARRPVPMERFVRELEASRNTVTRDFSWMRDFLGAPIAYDREHNGHYYDSQSSSFELPGFWMNASELYALLVSSQLLESVQPGLMAERLAPLKARIRSLLGEAGHDIELLEQRVQVQPLQIRPINEAVFAPVAAHGHVLCFN